MGAFICTREGMLLTWMKNKQTLKQFLKPCYNSNVGILTN